MTANNEAGGGDPFKEKPVEVRIIECLPDNPQAALPAKEIAKILGLPQNRLSPLLTKMIKMDTPGLFRFVEQGGWGGQHYSYYYVPKNEISERYAKGELNLEKEEKTTQSQQQEIHLEQLTLIGKLERTSLDAFSALGYQLTDEACLSFICYLGRRFLLSDPWKNKLDFEHEIKNVTRSVSKYYRDIFVINGSMMENIIRKPSWEADIAIKLERLEKIAENTVNELEETKRKLDVKERVNIRLNQSIRNLSEQLEGYKKEELEIRLNRVEGQLSKTRREDLAAEHDLQTGR